MLSEEWTRLLAAAGLASGRDLGRAAGLSHEGARRVVEGESVSARSIAKVAAALGVDPDVVWELNGTNPGPRPWSPPPASAHLTADERSTLARLILLMTRGRDA